MPLTFTVSGIIGAWFGMSYTAVGVSIDSVFTNVVVVRLITLTSVPASNFIDSVYNMEAVLNSNFKLMKFFDISQI